MAASGVLRRTIASGQQLQELLEHTAGADSRPITIELRIPRGSQALRDATDFRRLAAQARERQLACVLVLDPEDVRRRSLAQLVGLPFALTTYEENGALDLPDGERDQETASLATYRPARPPEPTMFVSPTGTVVLAPESPQRTAVASPKTVPVREAEQAHTARPRQQRLALRRWTLVVGLLGFLLIGGGIAAMVALLFVPRATLVVTPQVIDLNATLTYGVQGSAPGLDYAVQPRLIEQTLTATVARQASGERTVPDKAAEGTVMFVNPYPQAVTIPAGTVLKGRNGKSYRLVEGVSIAAADPFGSLSFGSALGHVVATTAGPDGNADAGVVSGQLDNGIFYNNQRPITGGTVRKEPVVTQADLDALRDQATAQLQAQVDGAIARALQPHERLLDGSLQRSDVQLSYDHKVGDVSDRVTLVAQMTVKAAAVDFDALHQQAREELGKRLVANAKTDVVLLGRTVAFTDPEPMPGTQLAWKISGHAQARKVISAAEINEIRQRVLGKSLAEAQTVVQTLPGVADVSVAVSPRWAPQRIPDIASHVSIVVREDLGGS